MEEREESPESRSIDVRLEEEVLRVTCDRDERVDDPMLVPKEKMVQKSDQGEERGQGKKAHSYYRRDSRRGWSYFMQTPAGTKSHCSHTGTGRSGERLGAPGVGLHSSSVQVPLSHFCPFST